MKKFILLAFAALAFAACSDEDGNPAPVPAAKLATPEVAYEIVSAHEVKISWKAVENAEAYSVAVDNRAASMTVDTEKTIDPEGETSCVVTVKALSGNASLYLDSDPAQVTVKDIPSDKVELTVDFEAAELGAEGYVWGKSQATEQDDTDYSGNPIKSNIFYGPVYTEKDADLYTYYTDYGHTYDSWNAFVVSNHSDMETAGYTNDKSVYATGGANGSSNFAVGYYSAYTPDKKGIPVVKFSSAVAVKSVELANSTYVYLYFRDEVTAAGKPEFKVVVTGYNGTAKTGDVPLTLIGGTVLEAGWNTLDLASLGEVTSIEFSIVCEDTMAPTYFCMDNLTYVK